MDKLRWGQHPESPSLVQLQLKNCGFWYTIEGTTTHSLNDAGKFVLMQRYALSLNLIKEVI
jgi:hypothetical protein